LGLDALSKDMLDHWRDNRRAKGKILPDPDADYRNWLRNEKRINPGGSQPRFAKLGGEPHLAASSADPLMAYFRNKSREADGDDE
jgi:hypothetical protein